MSVHQASLATAARPVEQTIGGIRYDDAFTWLEDDTEEVARWQATQVAATAASLGAQARAASETIDALTPRAHNHPPRRHGRFWFRERRVAGVERSVVEVQDDLHGPATVLIDPAELTESSTATILAWTPSPDGELVAFVHQVGGAEVGSIRLMRTRTGELLPDRLPQLVRYHPNIAWYADSGTFLFSAVHGHGTRFQLAVFRHVVGAPARTEPEPLPANEMPFLAPQISSDGRYAVVNGDPRGYRPLYLKDLGQDGEWRPFLEPLPDATAGDFVGDEYVAVTSRGAPRGRIVAIPIETAGDPDTWRELVAESEAVLNAVSCGVQVDGDRLVVTDLVDVAHRVRILDHGGAVRDVVRLPGLGSATVLAHQGELTLSFSELTRSPTTYQLRNGVLVALDEPELIHDQLVDEFHRVTAPDGTALSYHLLYRRDLDRSIPWPALVHAYGGWNIPLLPAYSPEQVAVALSGPVVVRPHIRGGGEYGKQWWDAGRLLNKTNSFTDLFAVVDHVVRIGLVDPDRLAFEGVSNGGMLAGVVATRRPDLFRVVIGVVPITDLFRLKNDPMSLATAISDYGDPDDPELAEVLATYSPYHQVKRDEEYPATLWLSGENDPRCPAWHGRKMVAALQQSGRGGPHLLSISPEVGHGSAVRRQLAHLHGQWVGFVLWQLGLELRRDPLLGRG